MRKQAFAACLAAVSMAVCGAYADDVPGFLPETVVIAPGNGVATNVSATLRNEFSSAGINQTRHRIILQVDVGLGILLSGYRDKWDDVQTEITVCETVIVGRVPETYASLS